MTYRTLRDYIARAHADGSILMRGVGTVGVCLVMLSSLLASCAKMGQPDGGWYDETPPRIIGASPADKGVNVKSRKIAIYFDEFIAVDNPTEKVVVSPPQIEQPDIKAQGKKITVALKDSLMPNTTYTVDFSDAISDNNEGNPLGNYTYSFSTGENIDTLEVSGNVVAADNLEPIKGILVGLYAVSAPEGDTKWSLAEAEDDAFRTKPLLRVSRTDSRGRFVIRGVAPGQYRVVALQDADGNYFFNQKSEMVAWTDDVIVPSVTGAVRQDTVWRDSLHIDSIRRVGYTRFIPDDIVLRAFTEKQTDRYFLKSERTDPRCVTFYFSGPDKRLPELTGLNFNSDGAFLVEHSLENDTVSYWLRDTTLVNQDTLSMRFSYLATDTAGVLRMNTDTIEVLAKQSYAKRLKDRQRRYEEWRKAQDKAKKRGLDFQTEMPVELLEPKYNVANQPDPDKNITIQMPSPLARIDTAKIHLYSRHDSVWYRSKFLLRDIPNVPRAYEIVGEWRPGVEYSFEVDSMAFVDIYGAPCASFKTGLKVKGEDEYATLLVTAASMVDTTLVFELLDASDRVVKRASTSSGNAEFFYLAPGTYYLRMFVDANANGKWDTGDYALGRQPEMMSYYPEKIECKAKWDVSVDWDPTRRDAAHQKPDAITKQKPEKDKTIKHRNAERARKMGIEYIPVP